MSYRQDGYDKGYQDGLAGKPARETFLDFLNTEMQTEWESGYDDGYAAGSEERKEEELKAKEEGDE